MKTPLIPFLFLFACSLAPLPAQMGAPAAELEKLEIMLGDWTGSGEVRMAPDEKPIPWTAVNRVTKILGGHFLLSDQVVDLGPSVPAGLAFRTIMGWDANSKSYFAVGLSNQGGITHQRFHFTDPKTIVTFSQTAMTGVPAAEQSIQRFNGDQYSFVLRQSVGAAPFFDHVKGTFKKASGDFKAPDVEHVKPMVPPGPHLQALEGALGEWTMKGKVSGMPGMPMMPFTGRQEVKSILGGHCHMGHIKGDPSDMMPMAYEGLIFTAWDPDDRCLKSVSLDNFGGCAVERAYMRDKKTLVYVSTPVAWGLVQAYRTVLEIRDDGTIHIASTRCAETNPPETSFECVLRRVEKKK